MVVVVVVVTKTKKTKSLCARQCQAASPDSTRSRTLRNNSVRERQRRQRTATETRAAVKGDDSSEMARKSVLLNYDELPRSLRKQIDPQTRRDKIDELEYYTAFQKVLKRGPTERQRSELLSFHTKRCLSAWVFDHDAHARYAYYPSNKYPLGSTMEYSFFMRQWARNVNRPHVKRLYDRGEDFETVLSHVDANVCPCHYLTVFNVLGRVEYNWDGGDGGGSGVGGTLYRVTVENELVMWSDFFNKGKENFTEFNRWFYDVYLSGDGDPEAAVLTSFCEEPSFYYRHKKCEDRARTRKQQQQQRKSRPNSLERKGDTTSSSSSRKVEANELRLSLMRDVTSDLLFGRTAVSHEKLLVRCEDYTSGLYSPLLRTTSCRHEDETVTYEQRRSGDEIKTEVRTCKRCGAVRAITN